jgi:hypothetical protein
VEVEVVLQQMAVVVQDLLVLLVRVEQVQQVQLQEVQ